MVMQALYMPTMHFVCHIGYFRYKDDSMDQNRTRFSKYRLKVIKIKSKDQCGNKLKM